MLGWPRAVVQVSTSSGVVRITGIAFGSFGSVVRMVGEGSIEDSSSKDHDLPDVGNRAVNSSWRKLYPHIIGHTARHIVLGSPMNLRAKASRSRLLESSLWTRTRFRAMRGAV
jgi:hypothetical protein